MTGLYTRQQVFSHLPSSPTGPAEHEAGGSFPKSCNSCSTKQTTFYESDSFRITVTLMRYLKDKII